MSKGSRRERQGVELYQRASMATYRPATVRYGENDMFGLFDLLALSPRHEAVHAVQVKSNRATGIEAWARHTWLFRQLGWRTFYLVPVDNEGWRLIECHETWGENTDTSEVVDERELSCDMGQRVVDWLKSEANDG